MKEKFTIAKNAFVVIADGAKANYYKNTEQNGVSLQKVGGISMESQDHEGASPTPVGTSPAEHNEAGFAKHIAKDLYDRAHKGEYETLVLVADPQTLGQIRPSLHKEVLNRITGELSKTLTNSSVADIEKSLSAANQG